MTIYFDHAATTKVMPEIAEAICNSMVNDYGNPSSLHRLGMNAEKLITTAKQTISAQLRVTPSEIYFTSGGTEANNLGIMGIATAYQRNGRHLITTPIEHASVKATYELLEEQGFEVSYVKVDDNGLVDQADLVRLIRKDTILVSIMHVNNEIGIIQNIEDLGKILKQTNPSTLFHVDGIQAFGKIVTLPKKWLVDAYAISGHKIHGPKGIGAIYIRKGILIKPMIIGGHQQKDVRSGTENVPGIVGIDGATKCVIMSMVENYKKVEAIKSYLIKGLECFDSVRINSPNDHRFSTYILSVSFVGIRGEVLLHALEEQGIYVSTGSACSSNKSKAAGFLSVLGRTKEEVAGNIRFSFDPTNTFEEIDVLLKVLKEIVPMLLRYQRK
ncbi:MAG: cysteine desulfurase family protein [Vallitaleaceae bacterium]|jgi:cysteine desulfurase|nr:cysteine desulfurase family protein [Vallitaleaceae bacterium]